MQIIRGAHPRVVPVRHADGEIVTRHGRRNSNHIEPISIGLYGLAVDNFDGCARDGSLSQVIDDDSDGTPCARFRLFGCW
jgi:hypothetical protein